VSYVGMCASDTGVGMGQWGVVRIYIHRSTQIRKYEC